MGAEAGQTGSIAQRGVAIQAETAQMTRGFLRGVFWGGLVSVLGAGALSVLSEGPVAPNAGVVAPESAEAPAVSALSTAEAVTDADLVRDSDVNQVASPEADDLLAAEQAGADTPVTPETGAADDLSGPSRLAQSGAVDIETDVPVQPGVQGAIPSAPDAEGELSISTDPAQPPVPTVPDVETAFAPEVDDMPEMPALEAASPDVSEGAVELPAPELAQVIDSPVSAPKPEQSSPAILSKEPSASDASPGPAPLAPSIDAPQSSDAPEAPATAELPDAPVTEPEPERRDSDDTENDGDVIAALPTDDNPAAGLDRPSIGLPATSLIDRAPDQSVAEEPENTDDTPASNLPPIEAFASEFENPDNNPLMSIVLIDTGADLTGGAIGLTALKSFPYPLTFAVDGSRDDATARMAEYREKGFEVMVMMDLPPGATAPDAEVALSAALDAVPEAVAVMEGNGVGLQQNRDAADQIAEAVNATGLGLVLQSKGLNTVQKLALRSGVPAGLVFRDFDSAEQTPSVIRRFLDQAAFRAGQEGGVIMVGRVRPDTISALLLWGLQDRAQRVALAPVSAVLTAFVEAQ